MFSRPSAAYLEDPQLRNLSSDLRHFITNLLQTLSELGARHCTFTLLPRTVQIRFFDPSTASHCILNYSRHSTRYLFGTELCERRLLPSVDPDGAEHSLETSL